MTKRPRPPRLTVDETLEMLERMKDLAHEDSDRCEKEGAQGDAEYWDGFADALWTLGQHIKGGVRVSCFPIGTCACHPFDFERKGIKDRQPFWLRWLAGLITR